MYVNQKCINKIKVNLNSKNKIEVNHYVKSLTGLTGVTVNTRVF